MRLPIEATSRPVTGVDHVPVISSRFSRKHRFLAVAAALVATFLLSAPVGAWSQLRNDWPDPDNCGDPGYPCIRWPKTASNLSVHVDVYPDDNLDIITEVDMRSILTNSRQQWNGAPARNPFLDVAPNNIAGIKVDLAHITLPFTGLTNDYADSNTNKIYRADVFLNVDILWNTTYTFGCDSVCHADARKVMTHELGHAEALGHTSFTAVMKQGATTYWKPRTNDIDGLQAIYGAYP